MTVQTEPLLKTSLAPHEGDLLSLPFDQYGRMRIAQNCLYALYTEIAKKWTSESGRQLRVLDVGGYPGVLRHFVDSLYFDVHVLDVGPDDGSVPRYTQGSGMELPFGDASFDVVTALDTLEHIPNGDRDRFLEELMRVAEHGVLLINPIQSLEADLAEETLNEFIRWVLDAQQEQLAEHREYGLPNFAHTIERFGTADWKMESFTTANVHNWLFMMIAKHYLIAARDEAASSFERTLDRFYNLSFSDGDMTDPAYRGVLVAVRPGLEAALDAVRAKYEVRAESESANAVRIGLVHSLMSMLNLKLNNHEDRKLREQIEHRDRHIAGLEQKIALQDVQVDASDAAIDARDVEIEKLRQEVHIRDNIYSTELERLSEYITRLEGEVKSKDDHILYLEKLLEGISSGRVMRLTRQVSRFLGR